MNRLSAVTVNKGLRTPAVEKINKLWSDIRPTFSHKIVVLDDDPTGVQTVHSVSVYTDWSKQTIEKGFLEDNNIFFILTNSRAFTEKETKQVHEDIANRVEEISLKLNQPYIIISRGDSTLRGHFPLETETMKNAIEAKGEKRLDGEIILPFFKEGGRLTINNTHYVKDGDELIPAGETEFAKDRTFGYKASHLGEWIEEKTEGLFTKDQTTYIELDELRELKIEEIVGKLVSVKNYNKVVVNALVEEDVKVFSIALIEALQQGKQFLFRTAAAFTKVIGDITSKPLLTRSELMETNSTYGGLIIIGSHVQKTTAQLQALKDLDSLTFLEFNSHLVLSKNEFEKEIERVKMKAEESVEKGKTAVIYTRRDRLDLGDGMQEEELKMSVAISDALTKIVAHFKVRPAYLIAKGGITSSDIGTKGLKVKKATVAGQIAPGIPVWKTGEESTFPYIPYVIFPGNVGSQSTLKEIVASLEKP